MNKVIAYFSSLDMILLHFLQRIISMNIQRMNSTLETGSNFMK